MGSIAVPLKSCLPASTFLQIDHVSVIPSAKVPSGVDGTDYNDIEMQICQGQIKTRGLLFIMFSENFLISFPSLFVKTTLF